MHVCCNGPWRTDFGKFRHVPGRERDFKEGNKTLYDPTASFMISFMRLSLAHTLSLLFQAEPWVAEVAWSLMGRHGVTRSPVTPAAVHWLSPAAGPSWHVCVLWLCTHRCDWRLWRIHLSATQKLEFLPDSFKNIFYYLIFNCSKLFTVLNRKLVLISRHGVNLFLVV